MPVEPLPHTSANRPTFGDSPFHLNPRSMPQDMESFLQTGHHPEVERLRTKQANAVVLLPEASHARPHVYMDLTISGKPAGQCDWTATFPALALHL